jgi:hypothetical protein
VAYQAHDIRYCIVGVIALAACSSGSDSEKTANPPSSTESQAETQAEAASVKNGCVLLTKNEARAALGSPIEDFKDTSNPTPVGTMLRSGCFYEAEDGSQVTLTIDSYPTSEAAVQKFQNLRKLYRGARDVPDLGEAAFADREALVVRHDNMHVMVKLDPEGAKKITNYSDMNQMNAILAIEREIATRAISRLPAGGIKVASTPTSAKSACSILPKAEMETILGGSLTHAVPADSPSETKCRYTGEGGRFAEVAIEWQGGETGMAGARMAGALMGQAAGGMKPVTAVEDLGDEAVMLTGGVLNVRKGAALISVDLRGQAAGESKSIEIAEKVLARM